ncbi:MAG: macro domain-containing protein [Lachnospiraceae bacterium]|nr:macro domain-containing protein [Lachnospiraceae bacterium]
MSSIKIQKISIVDLDTDAIVNAANSGLLAGGGVCGAIFEAAGYDKLTRACSKIGHCKIGSAVITPGFDLKAKYIIHAVGPIYSDGRHGEAEMLYNAYKRSLELAVINGCKSIGFPLISAGIFGYPLDEAWELAMQACRNFNKVNPDVEIDIIFAVLSDSIIKIGEWSLNRPDD